MDADDAVQEADTWSFREYWVALRRQCHNINRQLSVLQGDDNELGRLTRLVTSEPGFCHALGISPELGQLVGRLDETAQRFTTVHYQPPFSHISGVPMELAAQHAPEVRRVLYELAQAERDLLAQLAIESPNMPLRDAYRIKGLRPYDDSDSEADEADEAEGADDEADREAELPMPGGWDGVADQVWEMFKKTKDGLDLPVVEWEPRWESADPVALFLYRGFGEAWRLWQQLAALNVGFLPEDDPLALAWIPLERVVAEGADAQTLNETLSVAVRALRAIAVHVQNRFHDIQRKYTTAQALSVETRPTAGEQIYKLRVVYPHYLNLAITLTDYAWQLVAEAGTELLDGEPWPEISPRMRGLPQLMEELWVDHKPARPDPEARRPGDEEDTH